MHDPDWKDIEDNIGTSNKTGIWTVDFIILSVFNFFTSLYKRISLLLRNIRSIMRSRGMVINNLILKRFRKKVYTYI